MKQAVRKLFFVLAIILFAGMALFSGYKVYTILAEYREGEKTSEALQKFVVMEPVVSAGEQKKPEQKASAPAEHGTEPTDSTAEPTMPEVWYPVVDFDGLLKTNPDVTGWIYIEDTNINEPIVQGTDNEYYVSHMVDGTSNSAGSIFMDYRNAPDFSDPHTVIYGHNMKNKTMFAHLTKYKDPEFFKTHSTGKIMTPIGSFQFEVIGGYVADLREEAWKVDFETDEEFLIWLQNTMERSEIGGTYVPDGTERIITLSTCDYVFDDARFVLVCRILE